MDDDALAQGLPEHTPGIWRRRAISSAVMTTMARVGRGNGEPSGMSTPNCTHGSPAWPDRIEQAVRH